MDATLIGRQSRSARGRKPSQKHLEDRRMNVGQELDARGCPFGPADTRAERFESRKARDDRIANLTRFEQFDPASACRDIFQCNIEVEAADPANKDR